MLPDKISVTDSLPARFARFMRMPWSDKRRSLLLRWARYFPAFPVPIRLPHGEKWLLRYDVIGAAVLADGFEISERLFVERFLRPGMNVLDIGANQGFYSLLASSLVGPQGRVIAFEPSPRERGRLLKNLRLNRCYNVQVEATALGEQDGEAELFVVQGLETGCNSLRPPAVSELTLVVNVPLVRLEFFLGRTPLVRIDFVKLDVEGAELSVLKGAGCLLDKQPRPVILVEVEEIRTRPWGYSAIEIVDFLCKRGFKWFKPLGSGELLPVDSRSSEFNGLFVAAPWERLQEMEPLIHRRLSPDEAFANEHREALRSIGGMGSVSRPTSEAE